MRRLVVALDAAAGLSPAEFATAWDADGEARALGPATLEIPAPDEFLADVLALVVIPLAVNLGSSAIYGLVRRLLARGRPATAEPEDLEIIAVERANGDRIMVVRRRDRP